MRLFDPLFGWQSVDELFSEHATVQRMLDFEAALARAEAKTAVIPAAAVLPIESKCDAKLFDLEKIRDECALSGNLAIPLVRQLTRLVAASDKGAAGFVHWGATSQDAIDSGLVLQLRDALQHIETDLVEICEALADLAVEHRRTPLAGRTWMQHGIPIVLGLKFAGWQDALQRHLARLGESRERALVVQFGGAAGTLASLGDRGVDVQRALAAELDLGVAALPWHTHRDRFAEIACVLGLLVGTLGKIARDISLLAQTEIGEILEPAMQGKGGSSTMPQKRNPVTAAAVLSASLRIPGLISTLLTAMVQENERGLGGWHAEWETLPELVRVVAGALHHLKEMIGELEIHPDRMLENLKATQGSIYSEAVMMALAPQIGRAEAHRLIEGCSREALSNGEQLREVVGRNTEITRLLTPERLDELFVPLSYVGAADKFIDRVLESSLV